MNKMMTKRLVSLMLSVLPLMSFAADMNEPFDFNYNVDGRNNRPLTVFNDGETTYIQGRNKQQLFFNGVVAHMRGPYYIVQGVPDKIEGYSGGDQFRIVWQGAKNTAISNESGRQNADLQQKTFSGTFGRISFINGVPPDVGLVNALPKNLQLREAMKALAPHGWSGSSDRSINTTQPVNVESERGDSWITVLDRMLTTLNIWIEIDSSKSNLYLRDAPPKGFSVVLDGSAQLRQPIAATSGERLAPHVHTPSSTAATAQDPVLASVNIGQIAHRKGVVSLVMINGSKRMRFTNLETGLPVEAKVADGRTYTLPIMSLFRIQTETGESVDVKRVFKRVAVFTPNNLIGLNAVTETESGTTFAFTKELPRMQFLDGASQSVPGIWQRDTFTTTVKATDWKIASLQSAVAVEMEDQGIFLWRATPQGLVASATSN